MRSISVLIGFKLLQEGYGFIPDRSRFYPPTFLMQSFDFSSTAEWDEFYKTPGTQNGTAVSEDTPTSITAEATEWHSSVPLDEIASVVPSNGKCLIIGCGNSYLPDRILQQRDRHPPRSLVLLDSSQTCLDQLRERFRNIKSCSNKSDGSRRNKLPEIQFVCGDATKLSTFFGVGNAIGGGKKSVDKNKRSDDELFDIIIDKGLTDAILCGEGWDGPLEKLLLESVKILSSGTGRYLLISYQLPSTTKNFLMEVGEKVGLAWSFDVDLNNLSTPLKKSDGKYQQVSVAMARKTIG